MIIAIWSTKGGTGVSSVALGLAKAMGDKVTLLDLNVYSPALASMLGLEGTHHGLDRIMLYEGSGQAIEDAVKNNVIAVDKITFVPGVKYPPRFDKLTDAEGFVRKLTDIFQSQTVIVDCGSGVIHPLQKAFLLRSDAIVVVVTPYLLSYHQLWQMWLNDFFIPHQQTNKMGVIVNRQVGAVFPQDIATLMDIWLAGELSEIKNMTEAVNQGYINEAYPRKILKELRVIGERILKRTSETATLVKRTTRMAPPTEGSEWKFEP